MNKKQITALWHQIVASVMATDAALGEGGEPLTEEEARTLFGMRLKRIAKQIVADTLRVDASDVVWVDVAAKAQAKAEEDSDDAIEDDSDDAIAS